MLHAYSMLVLALHTIMRTMFEDSSQCRKLLLSMKQTFLLQDRLCAACDHNGADMSSNYRGYRDSLNNLFTYVYLTEQRCQNSHYVRMNDGMTVNNELETVRKLLCPALRWYSGICLERLSNSVRTVHVSAKTRTGHLKNTYQKFYRLSRFARI
jgi:hypothetical protein